MKLVAAHENGFQIFLNAKSGKFTFRKDEFSAFFRSVDESGAKNDVKCPIDEYEMEDISSSDKVISLNWIREDYQGNIVIDTDKFTNTVQKTYEFNIIAKVSSDNG